MNSPSLSADYKFVPGVAGFQLSNPPVLQTVSLLASLEVCICSLTPANLQAHVFIMVHLTPYPTNPLSKQLFEKTSMAELRAKSFLLTGFLELLLQRELASDGVTIITPSEPSRRGCQLSCLWGDMESRNLS